MEKATFIIAISGGVDSVVLLHKIARNQQQAYESAKVISDSEKAGIIVAHFDHGIRQESKDDAQFVQKLAKSYDLPCIVGEGKLGKDSSEDTARKARYAFLRDAAQRFKAQKIITAHHQDDYIETIVLNILRGTSGRGLAPMRSYGDIVRPLLGMSKSEIVAYAKQYQLQWREDSTNQDTSYLRNYIRHNILPKIDDVSRKKLLAISEANAARYDEIDRHVKTLAPIKNTLPRMPFLLYPYSLQKEIVRRWLMFNGIVECNTLMIERVVNAVKTLKKSKKLSLNKDFYIQACSKEVVLRKTDQTSTV